MDKSDSLDSGPKNWWLSGVFWFFIIAEFFCFCFVIKYWTDLQISINIPKDEAILQAVLGSSIVLGFIRALLIILTPLFAYLVLALSTRILYAKKFQFGGLSVETTAKGYDESESDYEKFEKMTEDFKQLKNENEELKAIAERVVELGKKKGVWRK